MKKKSTLYATSCGSPLPLGVSRTPVGFNFSLLSRHAEAVSLVLFHSHQEEPVAEIPFDSHYNKTGDAWHILIHDFDPALRYGFRLAGPFDPTGSGHWYRPGKVLLDPYAKALSGGTEWGRVYRREGRKPGVLGSFQRRCLYIEDDFDWAGDRPLNIPLKDTIIYEMHVRGFTRHPASGVKHPGTYQGIIEKIPYLKELGITAVELMPVMEFNELENTRINPATGEELKNFWGYSTLAFFAPKAAYAVDGRNGRQVREFKEMVKALHRAGIEVILDVVYNHTAEGNHLGPTYSFRGIDNPTYYVLGPEKRHYRDYTGCGNSLDFGEPHVIKMVMDSLRYWVEVMRVDGFRFDLATVLGRAEGRFDRLSAFFTAVHQDPVLSRVKLIAEPWDLGWDAYQAGNFPVDWAEWNGKYRDAVRRFIKGDGGMVGELATRLTGSADLYQEGGRTPYHSVNFVTCHDGFTLQDLVTYDGKRNEANGEDNRDGSDANWSWNCGHEGPTGDPAVLDLRARQTKNFLALLLLSQGVPMLLGGDEFLRTQRGNNNAYCQDNPLSWFDWTLALKNDAMVDYTRGLVALRRRHPHFRRRAFFTGTDGDGDAYKDIHWLDEDLNEPDWDDSERRSLAFLIEGGGKQTGGEGDFLILVNAHWEPREFRLPDDAARGPWRRVLDTALPAGQELTDEPSAPPVDPPDRYLLRDRSVVALYRLKP